MPIFHAKPVTLFTIVLLLFFCSNAFGKEVAVSFKLEHHFIEHVLLEQVFTSKGQSLRVNDDGTGCNFLELSKPRVIDTKNELVRVRVDTWARIGQAVGDRCLMLLDWRGKTDLYNAIELAKNGRFLSIVVKESKLLNRQGMEDESINQVWQWFNANVYPAMNQVTIDLNRPISQLKSFIPVFIPKSEQQVVTRLANSFAIKNVAINPKGILLSLHFDVPQVAQSQKPVPPLSQAELDLLKKKLDALDAFVTYTLQSFLTPDTPLKIRVSLLETLINLRYDIIGILSQPKHAGRDPVKRLFISTWQEIAPLIHEIAKLKPKETISLGFLTFIAANDVLYTIEEIGPALGLDISVDGLKRLARLLNADPKIDPLELDDKSIPSFYLSQKVMSQLDIPVPRAEAPAWLDFFISPAMAKTSLDKSMVNKLNRWVPKKNDMGQYLPMVEKVIEHAAEKTLRDSDLDKKYHKLYRSLVYAAAWQESCWRQFEAVKGQRWPLKSRSGDLGMMQINPRVWRGFYNIYDVKWDIVYNAQTGADILMYYLQRYSIRHKEHIKTGKLENLARSAYAGYNGGPRQYKRYRDKSAPKLIQRIDRTFYKKFLSVYNGDTLAVKSCYPGI